MKDYKGMDSGQYSNANDKYLKMMKGKSPELMKSHGNVSSISSDAQKYDMKRASFLAHEKKGYDDKAFEYKY